jgi:hypothetical protein
MSSANNGDAIEDKLKEGEDRDDTLAKLGGVAVVLGLLAEVWLAFKFAKGVSVLEHWGPVVADVLVAAGVATEILFAARARSKAEARKLLSDSKVAEANERAAEANRKAEEAALELARFKAPRILNNEQLYRVADKLKPFAPLIFDASVNPGNPEYVHCLRSIEIALTVAGWKQAGWDGPGTRVNRQSVGLPAFGSNSSVSNVAISFLVDNDSPKTLISTAAAMALVDALFVEGIVAEARPTMERDESGAQKPRPIHIAVGTKT